MSGASRDVVRRFAAHRSLKAWRLDDQHIALKLIENPFGRVADQSAADARAGDLAPRSGRTGSRPWGGSRSAA